MCMSDYKLYMFLYLNRNQLCSSPAGGDVIAQVLSCLATSDQSEWM